MSTILGRPPVDPLAVLRASDVFADLSDALLREAAQGMEGQTPPRFAAPPPTAGGRTYAPCGRPSAPRRAKAGRQRRSVR